MMKRLTYLLLFSLLLLKGVSAAFPSTLSFSHKAFSSTFNNNQGFYTNPDVKSLDTDDLFIEEREEEEETENTKRTFSVDLAHWIFTAGLHSISNNPTFCITRQAQGFTQTANHIFIRVIRV